MNFTHYDKTDSYYKFYGENGEVCIIPATDVILIDDESGKLSIKLIGSRKTIGLVPKV